MANKSISQLNAGAAVAAGNLVPVVQTVGVGPVKITASAFGDYFLKGSYTNNTLVYDSVNSRIGIGTTSPAQLLDVQGASNPLVKIKSTAGVIGNYAGVLFDSYNTFSGTGQAYIYGISSATGNSNTDLSFGVNASGFGSPFEAMRINSTGNVGIGSTTPTQALYIQRAGAVAVQIVNSANAINMLIGATTADAYLSSPNGAMAFNAAGSERMRITSAGNVGIGTASPSARLHVSGGSILLDNATAINWRDNGGTARTAIFWDSGNNLAFYSGTDNAEKMRITSAGNVGIGTSAPSYKLDVTGIIRAKINLAGDGTGVLLTDNGTTNGRVEFITSDATGRYRLDAIGDTRFSISTVSGGVWAEAFSIDRVTRNVGIGTTSPGDRFVVANASANVKSRISAGGSASYTASLALGTTTRDWEVTAGGSSSNYLFSLSYTGTDAPLSNIFVATKGGNVGIGTSSPGYKLDISEATLNTPYFRGGYVARQLTIAAGTDGSADGALHTFNIASSAGQYIFSVNSNERMRITSAGNILIGTTSSPTTGTQCLTIETETAPTATPADTVTFYSSDLSAGNTMPSFYTEGTIVGTGTPTTDRTIAVRINGTVYYLLASTIP